MSTDDRSTVKAEATPDETLGQTLGRYKLLEKVGEGGCGVVYVAEQSEPVRRRVALKVIKLGMDTKAVVARFEAERQALAMMDHPNIAKVLDAAATEQGRPYFVMELVRGIKITEYCDQSQLTTRERLELFIPVCQAIQHAHQKGIIHRDIKPSNILVTLHDGVPVPHQGYPNEALTIASAAFSRLEQMRAQGDQGEPTLFGMGLALFAQVWGYRVLNDLRQQLPVLQRGVELLKPFASSAQGSRRVKLLYADFLGQLSHRQPIEQGIPLNEEAMRVLAGLGALDWSDLTAASSWADKADSEARASLAIGRLDDAERLEKQTQTLAEGVLARRPGDLRAMKDLSEAAEVLAISEAHRFHDAEALELGAKALRVAEDYVRANPSDEVGWHRFGIDHFISATMSFRLGRVAEALQKARTSIAENKRSWTLLKTIAEWEAQRSNRPAAEEALLQASRSLDAYASRMRLSDQTRAFMNASLDEGGRHVKVAFGEDQAAYTMAERALDRIERLRQAVSDPNVTRVLLLREANALADSARAALNLGRYTNAETAAQALLSLRELANDFEGEESLLNRAADGFWGRVLLAQAVMAQGRANEALKVLEPALAHYREDQVRGATHVSFRQHFARALYVQALAEPHDPAGRDRSRMELAEATRLLQGLSDEARQLHDSTQLLGWIEHEKLNQEAPHP